MATGWPFQRRIRPKRPSATSLRTLGAESAAVLSTVSTLPFAQPFRRVSLVERTLEILSLGSVCLPARPTYDYTHTAWSSPRVTRGVCVSRESLPGCDPPERPVRASVELEGGRVRPCRVRAAPRARARFLAGTAQCAARLRSALCLGGLYVSCRRVYLPYTLHTHLLTV